MARSASLILALTWLACMSSAQLDPIVIKVRPIGVTGSRAVTDTVQGFQIFLQDERHGIVRALKQSLTRSRVADPLQFHQRRSLSALVLATSPSIQVLTQPRGVCWKWFYNEWGRGWGLSRPACGCRCVQTRCPPTTRTSDQYYSYIRDRSKE